MLMQTGDVPETVIEIRNRRGLRMAATLSLPEEQPAPLPAALLIHGFRGHREERHIRRVAAGIAMAGVIAMRVDLTNNVGESDGRFHDVTLSGEIDDALDALEALAAHRIVDGARLGVAGHSLGGLVAALVAARRTHGVRALVTMSAVFDFPRKFGSWLSPGEIDAWRERGFLELEPGRPETRLGFGFREDLERNARIVEEIARAVAPTLVVHGEGDAEVPTEHAESYRRSLPQAEAVFISGADHTYTEDAHADLVARIVGDWFHRTLVEGSVRSRDR